tara:strand:- start:414 stop:875 length:462 start_codon:yes stop_codon:yes gene_type:complete
MAGFFSGQDGQLIVSDKTIAKVRSWSFTVNQAVLETVSLEDTDRTLIPGIRSITGSCSVHYYAPVNNADTDTGTFLSNMITATTADGVSKTGLQSGDNKNSVQFNLRVLDGDSTRHIIFWAFITSLSMTNSVGEVMSADVSFEVDGAVTGLNF